MCVNKNTVYVIIQQIVLSIELSMIIVTKIIKLTLIGYAILQISILQILVIALINYLLFAMYTAI